jgi:hypothetical protein
MRVPMAGLAMMGAMTLAAGGAAVPDAPDADGPKLEKVAFMGVTTSTASEALRTQVGLPKGIGLVVDYVEANSPADKGGIQVHDVLHKLNDQLLVSPQQLAILVRLYKPQDKVSLTVVRGGKTVQFDAVLGEKELPPIAADGFNAPRIQVHPPLWRSATPERRQEMLDQMKKDMEGLGIGADKLDQMMDHVNQMMQRRWDDRGARGLRPGTAGQPDTGGGQTARMTEGSITSLSDGHSLTLTTDKDGHKRLYAVDKDGKVLFDGPVNSKEDIDKVPESLRGKLKELQEAGKTLAPDAPENPGKVGSF